MDFLETCDTPTGHGATSGADFFKEIYDGVNKISESRLWDSGPLDLPHEAQLLDHLGSKDSWEEAIEFQ